MSKRKSYLFFNSNLIHAKPWLVLGLIMAGVLIIRRPSLDLPFSNDGGANAYHARLITQGDPLYSTHHTAHHLPAVYYTYALAFRLFGDSTGSVKFMVLIWVLGTVYIIYRLGALLQNTELGLLAAGFYGLLSAQLFLKGPSGEIELFANLPRTAAILVLLRLNLAYPTQVAHRKGSVPTNSANSLSSLQVAGLWWGYSLVGALTAVALLFKVIYVSPLVLAGLILLAQLWLQRTSPGIWRATFSRALWIGAGFLAVMGLVVAYFAWAGLWSRLWLVFTLGQKYVGVRNTTPTPLYVTFFFPLFALGRTNALLFILSVMAVIMVTFVRRLRNRGMVYIVLWYLLSVGQTLVTRVFLAHYYLLILPAMALLAAWMLLKVYTDLKKIAPTRRSLATGSLACLVLVSVGLSLLADQDYYKSYIAYKLGRDSYEAFLLTGEPLTGTYTLKAEKAAAYIQAHTEPDDYVYYWSDNMQFYYFVNRRSPVDIIWPFYVEATGSYQRIFAPQTKYVVIDQIQIGDEVYTPDWMYEEVAKAYVLETVIEGQEVYRRVD